jgi:predicted esterase
MYNYEIRSEFLWEGVTCSTIAIVRVPDSEDNNMPVVVLIHGTGGTALDMSDPASRVGFNYDLNYPVESERDHQWNAYPGIGPRSLDADPKLPVSNWQDALNQAGFRTVNYSQIAPRERLPQDIAQLKALLQTLLRHPTLRGRCFVLLGHSRGGVLARATLVEAYKEFDTQRIKQIVTLHSPNQGSGLANVADAIASIDRRVSSYFNVLEMGKPLVEILSELSDFIQAEAGSQAYLDYEIGSQFLREVAHQEPVPGVNYVTFGGTSTKIFRFRIWVYTPESAVPLPHIPPWKPFHWSSRPVGDTVLSPTLTILGTSILTGLPIPLPLELTDGIGDLLVTDIASRLPFARHFTNSLNHAEALWSPEIHTQVIQILQEVSYPLVIDDHVSWPEFDVQFYLATYPDLQNAFGTDYQAALDHWLIHGLPKEGRRGSREFDVQFYLATYPDLQNAFSTDYQAALDHWLIHGLPKEGRRGSREFDVQFYLATYPDLQNAFGTDYQAALDHWLIHGSRESRQGRPLV